MKFPHLKGREKLLEPLGFARQEAEWITPGLPALGSVHARPSRGFLWIRQVHRQPLYAGVAPDTHFAQTNSVGDHHRRPPNLPHLRQADLPRAGDPPTSVTAGKPRLKSPGGDCYRSISCSIIRSWLGWGPSGRRSLASNSSGSSGGLLPCRIYAGHAKGQIHYFPLKMPVAMGPEAAVFVYIDPGMGTRSELDSWREAHRPLWQMLRECGWRVEVVAVAWEQELLDRAERVLQSWIARDMTEADRELLTLRQAVSSADWDTVERYGGLNAALKKINQLKQATPEPKGLGMIDDFHLWGSRRCRRIHAPLKKAGWLI